jgi:multimeric flavodoxin WrbA
MKKILGIVGSPRRKGNTHLLVEKILEGGEDAGAETEILFLGDKKITECDGCHACWKGKPCIKNDDMNDLYDKIAGSDVLVFGTPVYWYGPTALMKGFIDRCVYFNCPENRVKIKNKTAILAIPFEEEDPRTADLTVALLEKSLGYLKIKLGGAVLAPGVTKRGEIKKKEHILKEGYELGKRTVRRLH